MGSWYPLQSFMHFATALVVHVPYELFHVENAIDGEKDKTSQPKQQQQQQQQFIARRRMLTTQTDNNNRTLTTPHQTAIKCM